MDFGKSGSKAVKYERLYTNSLLKKSFSPGRSKRVRCKAFEILRSEAYLAVRRNDTCAPKRFSTQATKDLPVGRGNAADGHFSATASTKRNEHPWYMQGSS